MLLSFSKGLHFFCALSLARNLEIEILVVTFTKLLKQRALVKVNWKLFCKLKYNYSEPGIIRINIFPTLVTFRLEKVLKPKSLYLDQKSPHGFLCWDLLRKFTLIGRPSGYVLPSILLVVSYNLFYFSAFRFIFTLSTIGSYI